MGIGARLLWRLRGFDGAGAQAPAPDRRPDSLLGDIRWPSSASPGLFVGFVLGLQGYTSCSAKAQPGAGRDGGL